MKKFLVLYRSTVSAAEQMTKVTPEQAKAGMDAWMAWAKKAGPGIVDLGQPLQLATTLTGAGKPTEKSALPVAGFSILQAASVAELEGLLKGHPHFMAPGASIAVYECLAIPGM